MEVRKNYKLREGERFTSTTVLKNIIKETDIPKAVVEEINSELWFETFHGTGFVNFQNGIKYEGHMHYGILESLANETSTLTFPNGTIYKGTIYENQISGQGEYQFANGSTYTGEVLNGLRNGHGIFKTKDGIIYEGEWRKRIKHRKGKINQGNMCLEGEWKEGIINGPGKIKWKSGNSYEGDLKNDTICGNGYMIWYNNNEKYTGQWKNNLQDGIGVHIWYEPKGEQKYLRDRYAGEWRNGMRNGYGKFYYSNGSIYEGYWINNAKEGFGILTNQDRTKQVGLFKGDRFIDGFITKGDKQLKVGNNTLFKNDKTVDATTTKSKKFNQTKNSLKNSAVFSDGTAKIGGLDSIKEERNNSPLLNNAAKETATKISPGETIKSNEPNIKSKSKKNISKAMDEIKIEIDVSDLIEINPEIKNSLKEMDNVLLRNLSLISHLYLYACGKESVKDFDYATSGSPSMTFETKSQFNNALVQSGKVPPNEEKKDSIVLIDSIYNNDLYFCLDLKGLWKVLRESGIISADFTLAELNRTYYQNMNNYIEMFFLPEGTKEESEEDKRRIYEYLLGSINKSKIDFYKKYRSQIQQGNISVGQSVVNEEITKKENILQMDLKEFENNFNYHDGKNIIMLRYFYELLVRVAYLKFIDVTDITLDQKMKMLFNHFRQFFKMKKKALDLSLTIAANLDIKLTKNWENSVDDFYEKYKIRLNNLFEKIYSNYVKENNLPYIPYDKVISYRYIYENIIRKADEKIQNIFKNKRSFMQIITLHFKDKFMNMNESLKNTSFHKSNLGESIIQLHQKTTSNPLQGSMISHHIQGVSSGANPQTQLNATKSNINEQIPENQKEEPEIESNETICYIEKLFDIEMIFYEFCEMMFIIAKKYETVNSKEEGDYEEVFSLIEEVSERKEKGFGKENYKYPALKAHLLIEKANALEEERRRQEQLRNEEIERFEKERKKLAAEDTNIYKPKKVEAEDEEEEDEF
ncbi:MAG: hypothetical protein MJ252_19705 [archaeon]|nr:hypothetical protein [archaeon]